MKQALFDEWLSALESGEYKQSPRYLHSDNGYCCLGVLCQIAGINSIYDPENGVFSFGGEFYMLPQCFAYAIGMRAGGELLGGTLEDKDAHESLSDLNDDGVSFDEIAAVLRVNPRRYIRSLEP